jgi:predicted metal-dependent TIM-barrel fold hydrolase
LAVPQAAQEMKRRGNDAQYIDKVVYQNPIEFMSQSPRFIRPVGL